ncbi:MAG: hypothetical protein AAGI48_04520 [Verrucomicrobiota bacterium]
MSEVSDQVWESMKGELQRIRRRRAMIRSGVIAGVGVLAVFGALKLGGPVTDVPEGPRVAPVKVEAPFVEAEPQRLAVLVYDGEGMRLELVGADQLAGGEMEFSLQPVVRATGAGDFW